LPELHHYIDRETSEVKTENLYYDRLINGLYSSVKEQNPVIFKALTSSRATAVLGFLNYDFTYYGFFNACACTLAAFIFLLLLGAVNVPLEMAAAFFIIRI
jgi:hypothetical protein